MRKSIVEEIHRRLILCSQSSQWFWLDLFYILVIKFPYESKHNPKIGLEWEVNLEENMFVDDGEICEDFDMIEKF